MLHHRITTTTDLDPQGSTYREWTPKVEDPQWQQYLDRLAQAADTRRRELGNQIAADTPQWAVEAFGPPPDAEGPQRVAWINNAASVAVHRELAGHDDLAEALGPAPQPGQVEAYASWRAAWRALGRPDADRAEHELSDGQLRLRVRAYQREEAWGPRYVANELAGTRQAAAQQRATAAIRTAEAAAAPDAAQREQFARQAREAAALADVLDRRAAELTAADQARAEWLVHTAGTRAQRDRAEAALSARHATSDTAEELVTAEEWLAEHTAAQRAEDPYRTITEADLTDQAVDEVGDEVVDGELLPTDRPAAMPDAALDIVDAELVEPDPTEQPAAQPQPTPSTSTDLILDSDLGVLLPLDPAEAADRDRAHHSERDIVDAEIVPDVTTDTAASDRITVDATPVVETMVEDIRDIAATEPGPAGEDDVRVPSAEETADTIARAQRALLEIRARHAEQDRQATEDGRAEQLARWHTDDFAAERDLVDADAHSSAVLEPVMPGD